MGIRILCLHGMGTNAKIFSAQTASLRKVLPSDYELVFLDGFNTCDAAPGVSGLYPGPYRCWYDTPSSVKVKKAHRALQQYLSNESPFDGVMGFSQGAALAASVLLHHEIEKTAPPFKFAIFICSPLPFSHSLEYGIDTRARFGSPTDVKLPNKRPSQVPTYLIPDARYLRGEERLAAAKASKTGPTPASFYQMFHTTVDDVRISIPSAHIIGARDEWRSHSLDTAKLCRRESITVVEHHGGHEIPRDFAEDLCDIVETLVADVVC